MLGGHRVFGITFEGVLCAACSSCRKEAAAVLTLASVLREVIHETRAESAAACRFFDAPTVFAHVAFRSSLCQARFACTFEIQTTVDWHSLILCARSDLAQVKVRQLLLSIDREFSNVCHLPDYYSSPCDVIHILACICVFCLAWMLAAFSFSEDPPYRA